MPSGTSVDRIFQALKREGKSVASAARISQAQTGTALATGKPPKHKRRKPNAMNDNDGDERGNAMRGF
jgi:hypothetical protein